MSCISIDINVKGTGRASVQHASNASIRTVIKGYGATFSPQVKNNTTISFFFICRAGNAEYLRVTPIEPMWVTVDHSITYNIHSNVEWQVV